MNPFNLPPTGFGPGSQPSEGDDELTFMPLPSGMRTYSAHLPDVENTSRVAAAIALLKDVAAACDAASRGGPGAGFDLSGHDPENRALLAETLGQGEVSMRLRGIPPLMVQESVFAGVWAVAGQGVQRIEVGPVPEAARTRAFAPVRPALTPVGDRPQGVVNAPALLAELLEKSVTWQAEDEPWVVNLSLLPHTEEDLAWLDRMLGEGAVTILSRGYGNCRVTATAAPQVWRVQYFNSMDTLILDTFEVTRMPEVALAAPEDLADSGARILEVLEAIR
ncbi:hydrogenase expression/formation protein [Cereibacter azotoformans]|uniref:Hydrogenase-1 expression HyaE n=1 Tax=Cereibacter sphaeroides (strain ATCC 17025 / ATH 2.4.3) TaxID=349102 RepID=A4WXY5_CERS5|nr:hydrogenase expression/formation protein [Cereibacter azotoformans]ULB11703.1 hydrogenase expression/formation protein [Cereibacter azotoformans]